MTRREHWATPVPIEDAPDMILSHLETYLMPHRAATDEILESVDFGVWVKPIVTQSAVELNKARRQFSKEQKLGLLNNFLSNFYRPLRDHTMEWPLSIDEAKSFAFHWYGVSLNLESVIGRLGDFHAGSDIELVDHASWLEAMLRPVSQVEGAIERARIGELLSLREVYAQLLQWNALARSVSLHFLETMLVRNGLVEVDSRQAGEVSAAIQRDALARSGKVLAGGGASSAADSHVVAQGFMFSAEQVFEAVSVINSLSAEQ